MSKQPTSATAAGRALLTDYWDRAPALAFVDELRDRILAIEAEAEARGLADRSARAEVERLDPDRLTAVIESRMSAQLAFLADDGKTVDMLGPEQVAWALVHLYRTGDIVSGLPPLAAHATPAEEEEG